MDGPVDRREKLLQVGLALSSELSLEAVLQRIIDLAAEVTNATYGALGVLGPDGWITEFITTGITEDQRKAIGKLPVGRGILGVLIHEAKPLRLPEISRDPRSVGFPPNHPPMHSFLGGPVMARGRVFGNIYLTEKQGAAEFDADDEEALMILAAQAGIAVENARLYEESLQRERRLEAVGQIATAILEDQDSSEILDLVAQRARELVRADFASIAIPEGDGAMLTIQAAVGLNAESVRGVVFPADGSVSGEVIRTGEPIILEDASADPHVSQPIVRRADLGPAMFVPLVAHGSSFGTLALANRTGGSAFGQADLELLKTFAGQAAVAVEYGRVHRELRRLAVLEDRERIAKELHDGVIQSLFAVGMGLQATATISGDPELGQRVEGAVAELDRVIRDLRNYIFGLRPGILADRQLDQALRHLAEDFQGKTGVLTIVEVDGAVAAELASQAGDVVQLTREALSNVGRHAGATSCRVSLVRRDETALLEIDDDGAGFDPAMASGTGQGLSNMAKRAEAMGGSVEVQSDVGAGTTVRITLPS